MQRKMRKKEAEEGRAHWKKQKHSDSVREWANRNQGNYLQQSEHNE